MPNQNYDPNIAHIQDGIAVFQVLNEAEDDWDELATREQYELWLLSK